MSRDFVWVPFVGDGGMGGDELKGMCWVGSESLNMDRGVSQNGEEKKKGLLAPKGYDGGDKDEGKLPFFYAEIAVDEDQLGLEPVKSERMKIADTQKPDTSENQD